MGKTRGVHETTPELRNRMVGMYEAGLGLRDIAAAVNCSQRTVKRWLNRFDKEGTVETRERCGRKRATTSEEDNAIIRLATQTPLTAAKAVLPALGLTCSVDTIRERLHKAGIHNWSPSRKHMQRIPLGEGDSATVQQAVWRPTGTQLGKKKLGTKESGAKSKKNGGLSLKKKARVDKIQSREAFAGAAAAGVNVKQPAHPAQFVFPQSATQQEILQNLTNNEIADDSLRGDQTQFDNSPSLVRSSSQPEVYQHHSGMNVAQNWPLDLVQGSHHYPQGQPRSMSHEQPPPQQQLQELHTPREQQHQAQHHQRQEVHDRRMDPHDQSLRQDEPPHASIEPQIHQQRQQRISTQLKIVSRKDCAEKMVRSDSCSNSSSSNDQMSDLEELGKDDSRDDTGESHSSHKRRKKKGGKAKGTLETSVEIRNRMIGMSEAGLSTLSIALAINRSERTVKRWLERWNKEGNVQTKERKGRRRITTKEQDDAIIAMATQHPLTAAKHVAPALGLNCSVDTIRERLHKAGIHSWKLGKKQGEGNAVHTVHLWQPSGNRPNKPKPKNEKRKKSSSDKKRSASMPKKSEQKKKPVEMEEPKMVEPPSGMVAPSMQFHDNGALTNYVPGPEMMQPVHNLSASLVPSSADPQVSSSVSQTMQIMGPMMQQRPDCRMANSIIQHDQPNPSVVYSSCMINAPNPHMDPQPDPLNYEPYIWSF